MKNQNLILYPSGAYGTFFEWVLNFLENPNIEMPFNVDGNSHKFKGNFLWPPYKMFEHTNSKNINKFSRTHPMLFKKINQHTYCYENTFENILQEDINFLKKYFNKILIISFDQSSTLWLEDNQLDKTLLTEETFTKVFLPAGYKKDMLKGIMSADHVERIKHYIDLEVNTELSPFTIKNLQGWNKNSIYDFERWDLRELLSFYWFTRSNSQINGWQKLKLVNDDLCHISITELKDQFVDTLIKSANYFEINVSSEQITNLEEIYQQWVPLQKHINKDNICNIIVETIRNQGYLDWSDTPLTIVDEAWIQHKLFEYRIGIKCDGLNIFPTNTAEFMPLLENIN